MDNDSVVWDDSFSVGLKLIDDQHKELVLMAEELFKGCKRGAAAADVAFMRTIRKAVEYAKTHFVAEENYMSQANYPELAVHKEEHSKFINEIINAVREFEKGNSAPIDMARFLKKWLLEHTAESDKLCAPYFVKLQNQMDEFSKASDRRQA